MIFAILLSFSLTAMANTELEKTVLNYKKAINTHDKDALKNLTTPELYSRLNKDKLLDRFFKSIPKKSKTYDLKVIESKVVKGYVLVEISEKGHKHEQHKEWLKLKKTDDGYKVEELIHSD